MKIIAFMNSYSHGKSGGDMVFVEIAKKLKNIDLTVVTSELGKRLCRAHRIKAKFLITTKEKEFKNLTFIYLQRIFFAFFLNLPQKQRTVFLGTSDFLPDVLPIIKFKIQNKKNLLVQHVFHLIPKSRFIPFISQRISLFFIKHIADAVVVDNSILKKELTSRGFDPRKIFINYPGITRLKKSNVRKVYDGVFMAQLRPSKGVFELISIWNEVCKKKPDAKLAIIGKGQKNILEHLRTQIKSSNLVKNVKLLGYLSDKKAEEVIVRSKLFVFPSHEEGFGIAPLEAQSAGLPVIAWNLPIFDEIFPSGMTKVKEGNVKKFSEEILSILRYEKRIIRLSNEALKNCERFAWNKTASRELALIESML